MVKGCEKRMVLVKNTGSELFEEAYFILNNKKASRVTRYDMIKEANRIAGEYSNTPYEERRPRALPVFLSGMAIGIAMSWLVTCIFII